MNLALSIIPGASLFPDPAVSSRSICMGDGYDRDIRQP